MNAPFFSVVTITLNCAKRAVQTAKSVLAQDFADYEYIVKDGGSTDGTVERLGELGIFVQVSKDSGIYDAMNQALHCCKGKFVCFLNAGDCFVAPSVLTTVWRGAQEDPSARLLYGDLFQPDISRVVRYPDRLSQYFLYRKLICHQVCFTDRQAMIEAGSFNKSFRLMADYDLLLRLVKDKGIHYRHISSVLASYRHDGLSSQASSMPQLSEERSLILRKNFSQRKQLLYELLIFLSGRRIRQFIWDNPYIFPIVKSWFGRRLRRDGHLQFEVEENS